MRVHHETHGDLDVSCDMLKVGGEVGLEPTATRTVARHLAKQEMIVLDEDTDGAGRVRITADGAEEAEEMQQSATQKWMANHPVLVSLFASVIGGLTVTVGGKLADLVIKAFAGP